MGRRQLRAETRRRRRWASPQIDGSLYSWTREKKKRFSDEPSSGLARNAGDVARVCIGALGCNFFPFLLTGCASHAM
jgi:hypothetical protein